MATKMPIMGIEVNDDQPTVEPVTSVYDFRKLAADESFMNELVTVCVAETTDDNQPPHLIVNCNGINQPIIRGLDTMIKRKYVEILARMKETKYTQVTNPNQPDQMDMRARTALCYPFSVIEDRNPKGRPWLQQVMAEAA